MKPSEAFEGDNSNMKKTFEEVVYEATPFSPGVLTVGGPAQKEDPFGDFLKTQGVNVVDVTPIQKEEWDDDWVEQILMVKKPSQTTRSGFEVQYDPTALIAIIRNIESLAEARGREVTITAFEEWAKKYDSEDYANIYLDDLLSFASSLKSNAPKV